jgi:hypothetical protein
MTLLVGAIWEIDITLKDPRTGTKIDPATITATITSPVGATFKPAVTHNATGEDTIAQEMTEPGSWKAVIATTSPQGVEMTGEQVRPAT